MNNFGPIQTKLSPRQISCLRYVSTRRISLNTASKFHQITLISLFNRDMIDLVGEKFVITPEGKDALKQYTSGVWWRKVNTGLAPTMQERIGSKRRKQKRYVDH